MATSFQLIGQKFGRLYVVREALPEEYISKQKRLYLVCLCDCGNETVVRENTLVNGKVKSCGCLRYERLLASHTKHGYNLLTGNAKRTFRIWTGMVARCTNPNNKDYTNYGGRGIKVCDRWLNSFEAFLEDMEVPDEDLQIDRIDNNQGYFKENCRWTTIKEQTRNRRSSKLITYDNLTMCLSEWEEKLGLPKGILKQRLKNGWTEERALTTPPIFRGQSYLKQ